MAHHSTKRRRVSGHVQDKHMLFTAWARRHGIEIHGVEAKAMPGRGLGLVTIKSIKSGDRILFVPEPAMFKPDNRMLEKYRLKHISSQAKLAVSMLVTFMSPSEHLEWKNTWPTPEDFEQCMPLYWDRVIADTMPRSSITPFRRQLSDYERDWQACEKAVIKLGQTEVDFKYFWMVVNSRSFHWSPPHGRPGHMVLCPFIDYMNHGPTGTGCSVLQRSDGYEVLAQRNYGNTCCVIYRRLTTRAEPGEEILASYGAHSNDKLLVHYGFMLPSSYLQPGVDDEIRIDEQVIAILSDAIKERLSDVGFLGPFALVPIKPSEDGPRVWEPCFKTQVAVRATIQTCNEWEFFAENGEDLSADASESVNRALAEALKLLPEEALSHASKATNEIMATTVHSSSQRRAQEMVKQRWDQIADVTKAFIAHADAKSTKARESA